MKGLRSSQAFTVRRCQILLASSRGLNATQIAEAVGCSTQNVRTVQSKLREIATALGIPASRLPPVK